MSVITRIAPSPTGYMHIGTARTALYNWLYARHHGGQFHVRIEDTDRARHSEEAVLAIVNGLKWLGLEWDGEIISQFEQRERHVEVAEQLLAEGKAYHCYCSKEELTEMRAKAKEEGRPSLYDRRWRDHDPSEAPDDIKPVIRIKAPLEGETVVNDNVQGEVLVDNKTLDDFILLRSDGTPTYMLSVVVDDHDMGTTHIIRGDDHLNNAFRQNIIYRAMGWDIPEYAHIPLIHGPDGAKLSKRHGAQSVEEYFDMGYLPEAMRNYLLRLGWSHGDDEIISTEQAIEWFDLKNVGRAPSRFDFAKLESLNTHYLSHADDNHLIELIEPFLHQEHDLTLDETATERLKEGMSELKERAKSLIQLANEGAFYAKKLPFEYDKKAEKILSDNAEEVLRALKTQFEQCDDFTADSVEQICRDVADSHRDGKLGKVAMPLRAALTGTTVSPSIFHAAPILGKEESVLRLDAALDRFGDNSSSSQSVIAN